MRALRSSHYPPPEVLLPFLETRYMLQVIMTDGSDRCCSRSDAKCWRLPNSTATKRLKIDGWPQENSTCWRRLVIFSLYLHATNQEWVKDARYFVLVIRLSMYIKTRHYCQPSKPILPSQFRYYFVTPFLDNTFAANMSAYDPFKTLS